MSNGISVTSRTCRAVSAQSNVQWLNNFTANSAPRSTSPLALSAGGSLGAQITGRAPPATHRSSFLLW